VQGLLIFGTRRSDPGSALWSGSVRVVYLDEAIAELARREPDHVLLSVFRPLLEQDDAALEKSAAADYRRITQTTVPGANPEQLAAIFIDWLSQRFKTRTPKQIAAMIAELTPIEETAMGRELIGIGVRRGRRAGMERGIERGMQQGLQTARGILTTMLKARFPKIPSAVLEEAGALPAPAMQQLAAEVMQMSSVAALKAWVARQQ
jgi:hypothetical protein